MASHTKPTIKIRLKTGHIFSKIIMLVLMVLLCLPCSIKRELKHALDIPKVTIEHSHKVNKTAVCYTFSNSEVLNRSFTVQLKYIPKSNALDDFMGYQNHLLHTPTLPFEEFILSSSVPIYILHEQYLI